jgi:hypothetical protein
MKPEPIRRWDRETALLAWLAACASIFSFLFYFHRGDILLYGDAVAHINIARRVFDSRTPGLLQLGTVWLPLPHLLMIPFLLSDWMWRTGVGGSIPSMAAYVLGTLGIFRLVRGEWSTHAENDAGARTAAWGAAIIYAANPNLIYLQATAMTEALYLALFIWALVYLNEFAQEADNSGGASDTRGLSSSLMKCGLCLAGAGLTRYDGWFLAVAMGGASIWIAARSNRRELRAAVIKFILVAAAAPVFWLAYNAIVYRNPLEFANGPYSARAIERRTPGAFHPGSENLPVAFSYFLKSAEVNVATGTWQRVWILLAVAGTLACFLGYVAPRGGTPSPLPAIRRRHAAFVALWVPLPFYALSVAHGGVPIFMPVWWPFSYYNVRYGLELLPALAVFSALAIGGAIRLARARAVQLALGVAAVAFVGASYFSIWRDPVCYREAWVNSRTRVAAERELANFVKALPPDSTLLMYLGEHVGALQEAGISLRRVIYEGNHRTWKQPVDREGLWERALASPSEYADFVIAFEGDAVSAGAQTRDLARLAVIHVSGQPRATIYQTRRER